MINWLESRFRGFSARIVANLDHLPLDSDEKHRLHHFLAFLALGLPTMAGFGIYNLWNSNSLLGAAIFLVAASVLVALVLLPKFTSGILLYRINMLFFSGLLLYMLALGGEAGSRALWLFTFPLVAFFLLGTREGLAWTAGMILAGSAVFWLAPRWFPVHHYSGQFTARFAAAFLIVSVLACWFEYLRQHFREGMQLEHQRLLQERAALEEALSKVKLLSGLLPICAQCRKVRDDRGYWTQMEAYIRSHSEAEFSHGLCPDCAETLYPGFYRGPGNPG